MTAKTLDRTFLYSKYPKYQKHLIEFIMTGEEVRKKDPAFDDIRYEVKKRQISNALINVLDSKNVILLTSSKPLNRQFRVFVAKDIKGDQQRKVFIDCSNLIYFDKGIYQCNNIDILIANLVNAMNALIYNVDEKRLVNNSILTESGADCFSKLFTHIVDYVYKISTVEGAKAKCVYLTSMYYMINLLGRDADSTSIKAIAKKLSGLSAREEEILELRMDSNMFLNIKFFVDSLNDILKLNNITLDIVVEKWMYLYGPGTLFALEMYPNFAAMITDAYVGCYINNQKTIEKITGRSMVTFSKAVLSVGESSI